MPIHAIGQQESREKAVRMLRLLVVLVIVLNAGHALALEATALEGGWRVTRLEDAQLPADAVVTIEFRRHGQASGRSGCNRFVGSYTLAGETLTFANLATTRMACPPPFMEVESRFLTLLTTVTRVLPVEGGRFRLMAGDRQALLLERTP